VKAIKSLQAPTPIGPYSQAVKSGPFIFVSGQLPINPENGRLEQGDVQTLTRVILTNIREILKAAGAEMSHVVKTTVYMTDLANFGEMNFVYDEFFSLPYPARSTVQVAALPAGSPLEIEVVACLEE